MLAILYLGQHNASKAGFYVVSPCGREILGPSRWGGSYLLSARRVFSLYGAMQIALRLIQVSKDFLVNCLCPHLGGKVNRTRLIRGLIVALLFRQAF